MVYFIALKNLCILHGHVFVMPFSVSGNATTEPRMRSVPDERTTPNIHAQSIGPTELNEHTTPNSHIQSIGPTEKNEHTEPNHRTEPNENTEQSKYTEPNENTEPNQHTDRNERSEPTEHTGKTTSGVTNGKHKETIQGIQRRMVLMVNCFVFFKLLFVFLLCCCYE